MTKTWGELLTLTRGSTQSQNFMRPNWFQHKPSSNQLKSQQDGFERLPISKDQQEPKTAATASISGLLLHLMNDWSVSNKPSINDQQFINK